MAPSSTVRFKFIRFITDATIDETLLIGQFRKLIVALIVIDTLRRELLVL